MSDTVARAAPARPPSKAHAAFFDNLWKNNPVFVQILGICSTLAVTNVVTNTVVMCLGLIWATAMSNVSVAVLRRWIPARVRMIVETLIIAVWVIIVDIVLRAWLPDISRQLGPYVGLIITNCIVMGRAETYALGNPPLSAFLDGLGNGLGYGFVLVLVAFIRELLGAGKIFDIKVIPQSFYAAGYEDMGLMLLAPGAFIVIGLLAWLRKSITTI